MVCDVNRGDELLCANNMLYAGEIVVICDMTYLLFFAMLLYHVGICLYCMLGRENEMCAPT